jgi:hypothetical protein
LFGRSQRGRSESRQPWTIYLQLISRTRQPSSLRWSGKSLCSSPSFGTGMLVALKQHQLGGTNAQQLNPATPETKYSLSCDGAKASSASSTPSDSLPTSRSVQRNGDCGMTPKSARRICAMFRRVFRGRNFYCWRRSSFFSTRVLRIQMRSLGDILKFH